MLALIAGTGDLPLVIYRHLSATGDRPLVCAMAGFEPSLPLDVRFQIEQLGSFLADLTARGVTKVCLAGAVKRPDIDPSSLDALTFPLVPRLQAAMSLGDDGTLREIIKILEEHKLTVVGAADLVPDLLPLAGIPTKVKPIPHHRLDAKAGEEALLAMGKADSGQACIIKGGKVMAQEGPEGTDAMLKRFIPLADDGTATGFGPLSLLDDVVSTAADWLTGQVGTAEGGVLFKAPKPNQDRRADLPVIGLTSAINASLAGLDGIIVEASGVMILDQRDVIAALDEAGMFLWVRE